MAGRSRLVVPGKLAFQMAGEDRHAARVTVGGAGARFEPQAYSQKWQDEAWLSILFPEVTADLRLPTIINDVAEMIAGGDRLHRWYLDASDNLEYELVLGTLPASNIFDFQIDFPARLEFLYQPPMSQELDGIRRVTGNETQAFAADGREIAYRPPEIVGSYAVYWHKSNNQYQTGKLCHIMRPKFVAANGDWRWGELIIDAGAKRMRIVAPAAWLAGAVYPVTLDPTVGYTSIGASTDTTEDYALAVGYAAGATGEANPGTAYLGQHSSSGTVTNYLGVYVYDGVGGPFGEARLAVSSGVSVTTTTGTFKSAAITWTGITNGTEYFIVAWSDNSTSRTYYDAGSETGWYNRSYAASPPDPFPTAPGENGAFNNRLSAYVDFTETGAAAPSVPSRLMLLGVGR